MTNCRNLLGDNIDRRQCRRFTRVAIFGISFAIGLAGLVRAADIVDRKLDLRNATDANGNYYVVFCARHSSDEANLPGHAFVVWGKEDSENQMSSAKAFGFYPADGEKKKMIFGNVKGELANEATKKPNQQSLLTHRLIVQVNKQKWLDSQKEVATWRTEDYNLFSNNCTHFAYAVAADVGLDIAKPGTEFPSHFLVRLIEEAKKHS
jgi:hypothetical protein